MTDASNQTTTPATDGNPVAPPPQISILDLRNVLIILDTAVDRKAFGGWTELMQIKEVRDKLANFVSSIEPPEEKAPESQATPSKPTKSPKKSKK